MPQNAPNNESIQDPSQKDEARQRTIHQEADRVYKTVYSDADVVEWALRRRIKPEWLADIDFATLKMERTELVDPNLRLVRHADLVWKVRFRGSWMYVVFVFEFQSTVDPYMPVRTLLEMALVYDQIVKNGEVGPNGELPIVVPFVVYSGPGQWNAPTDLLDLLGPAHPALIPYATGQKFFLFEEAEEAKTATGNTAMSAGLKLRQARTPAEYLEMIAKLGELLPTDSPKRKALTDWMRVSIIVGGAKEEEVAHLETLDDLANPFVARWEAIRREARRAGDERGFARGHQRGLREGHQDGMRQAHVEMARRKFGPETGERLAAVLADVSDTDRLVQIGVAIIDCATGDELLDRAAQA